MSLDRLVYDWLSRFGEFSTTGATWVVPRIGGELMKLGFVYFSAIEFSATGATWVVPRIGGELILAIQRHPRWVHKGSHSLDGW